MSFWSCITDPLGCAAHGTGSAAIAAVVPSAWDAICKSFAQAAAELLGAFGKAFAALPDVNPASAGISGVYGMSLALAAFVAALLVFGQIIRTAWTQDGSGLAQAVTGTGKAIIAWLATAAVATASLAASDEITQWIVRQTFGSQQALAVRLGDIVNWAEVAGDPGQIGVGASLLLVFAVIGIVLTIVLWFELLLRNAALAVLIAMSPIAAAGQVSETTRVWWQRTCSAAVQLIILKPVIALVFAVGFGMAGTSQGIEALLAGLLVLGLAVFAWPVIARFFTFATIQASSSGLATALGFAAGRMSSGSGQTAGVNPQQWSLSAEQRTMAAHEGTSGGGMSASGAASSGAAPAGPSAGTDGGASGGSGGGAGAVAAGVGFALNAANRIGSMLAGRMEQTAGHAGMHGAYPYSTVGGSGQRVGSARPGQAPEAAPAGEEASPSEAAPPANAAPSPAADPPASAGEPPAASSSTEPGAQSAGGQASGAAEPVGNTPPPLGDIPPSAADAPPRVGETPEPDSEPAPPQPPQAPPPPPAIPGGIGSEPGSVPGGLEPPGGDTTEGEDQP